MTKKGFSLVTNFSSGELDPKLRGRVDFKAYAQSATVFRNVQPFAGGGARPRPGTRYRATLAGDARLIDFIFDDDEKYIIALANAAAYVFTPEGSLVQSLVAPWTLAQAFELTYVQLYDKVFLAHRDVETQVITRTGLSSFTIGAIEWESYSTGFTKQPFWKYEGQTIQMATSAESGSVALGAFTDNGATPLTSYWTADHIGRRIRMYDSDPAKVGELEIVGPVAPGNHNITANVIGTPTTAGSLVAGGGALTSDWAESAFNSARGYPCAVGLFDKRLWLGGGKSAPEGIWASRIDAFFDHDIGPEDDDPIRVGLVDDRVQEIRHIMSPRQIGFLTREAEWIQDPKNADQAVTPSSFNPKRQTKYGSKYGVRPVFYDGAVLFPQKNGRTIREVVWKELEQTYDAQSASLLAGHLIQDPIDTAVQYGTSTRPEQFAYFVNTDGSIAVFHAIRDQEIAGWGLWHVGASHTGDGGYTMDTTAFTMDDTTIITMDAHRPTGRFRSVAALDERLYAVVERQGVCTLEEFDPALSVDGGKTVSLSSPGKVFTGLSHLEGKTVWAVWRGYTLASGVVTSGQLDLSAASIPNVTDMEIGESFAMRIKLMPADFAQAVTGNVQHGSPRRIVSAVITPERLGYVQVNGWPIQLDNVVVGGSSLSQPTDKPTEFFLYDDGREPAVDIYVDRPTTGAILSVKAEVIAE